MNTKMNPLKSGGGGITYKVKGQETVVKDNKEVKRLANKQTDTPKLWNTLLQ